MKIYQSRSFGRKVKKFNKNQKARLDEEVKKIVQDPSIGVEKKGYLKVVFVHKFKIKSLLYLLSYQLISDGIELITIGPHENYYRSLTSYLKERK